jgi:hypothetical protein
LAKATGLSVRRSRSRPAYIISRVGDLLAVQNCEAVNLFDDVTNMDRGRRRTSLDDRPTMSSQVIRRDFRQKPVAPRRQQFAFEDRSAHGSRAVRHRRCGQPFLTEFAEALGFQEATLFPLLFDRRRSPFGDCPLGVDAQLTSARER